MPGARSSESPAPPPAGARRKSGRQSIKVIAPPSVNRGSDSDSDSLDDDAESGYEDGPAEEAPVKRKRTPAKVKQSAAKPRAAASGKMGPPKKRVRKPVVDSDEDQLADSDDDVAATGGKPKGDAVIAKDNAVFNAVKNPGTSLQSTVDDWIQSYEDDEGSAMAELINFVLRACGCNSTITEHQAIDEDGIVEVLEDIDAEFKNLHLLAYPLVSKAKPLKKFRASLTSFLTRLFTAAAASDILYGPTFCQTLQAWLTSLSSSKIRSFRHTATVVCLISVSALCDVAVAVNKEFASASRAKEAEENKGKKDKARLLDFSRNVEKIHAKKTVLEEYLSELFEAVFVHRYRDSEPLIRAECIKSLGGWMKVYPEYWLEGNYLRYIGWVLSDENKDVRQESVKALISLYARDDTISSMQHFTERFKVQLIRMATSEIDLGVRISCIHVLRAIYHHGFLDDDQQDQVATLIFEQERRVREAIAGFFAGLLEEQVKERETDLQATARGGKSKAAKESKARLTFKCLAELLVKYGHQLDAEDGSDDEAELDEAEQLAKTMEVDSIKNHRGRLAFAVEALWDETECVRDWQGLINYLLLDHSVSVDNMVEEDEEEDLDATPNARKIQRQKAGKRAAQAGTDELESVCKLTEEEETVLIEVLVAALGKATGSTGTTKKDRERDDNVQADVTRVVIDALPRLFAQHQTVPARIVDILSIPRLIKLDLYLDMQMLSAYESLWDDVTKQLLKHTDVDVIDQAVKTLTLFLSTAALGNTNSTKASALEDALVSSLRKCVEGKDLETSTFDDDEPLALAGWLGRIAKLFAVRDLSASLDDAEAGTSAWEIIDSLSERGHLGYKAEGPMIEHSLTILYLHLSWKLANIAKEAGHGLNAMDVEALVERRAVLLERLEEFAVGTSSNAVDGVKQASLVHLLNIHLLSNAVTSTRVDPQHRLSALALTVSDELQYRCAGYVQAEIERYAQVVAEADLQDEELAQEAESSEEDEEEEESSDDEEGGSVAEKAKRKRMAKKAKAKAKKAKAAKKPKKVITSLKVLNARKLAKLLTAEHFERTLAPFVRAIHAEVIDLSHAAVILAQFERFGAVFDSWAKLLAQDLKDEGIYGNQGALVAQIIFDSFRDAAELYISDSSRQDDIISSLSRLLSSTTLVRGPQLSILKRLPAQDHIKIQQSMCNFIVETLVKYDDAERKEERSRAMALFKSLGNLLVGIEGRSALTIKSSLEAKVQATKLKIPTSKLAEPYRAYIKRLITIAGKDPSIKAAATKSKNGKKPAASPTTSAAEEEDDDDLVASPPPVKSTAPRASRIQGSQPARIKGFESDSTPEPERQDKEMVIDPASSSDEDEEDRAVEDLLRSSEKRAFTPALLDDDDDDVDEQVGADEAEDLVQPPSSSMSVSDLKRMKKKARRV